MNCPGSIKLINSLNLGRSKSSFPAAEGTAAHELCAECLETGTDAWEHTGTKILVEDFEFIVDDDMVKAVQVYLDFVRGLKEKYPDSDVRVEVRLSSKLNDNAYGTGDYIMIVTASRIIVVDYKHGRGVMVEPDTPQLKYYGYLAYENLADKVLARMYTEDGKPFPMDLYIVQPRKPHPDGPVRVLNTTVPNVVEWFKTEAVPAMEETAKKDANLQIGNWCGFCPAKEHNICPALKKEADSIDTSLYAEAMTDEELGAMHARASVVAKYFEAIGKEVFRRVMGGNKVPGVKLVNKKAIRTWRDGAEVKLKKEFGDDAYTKPKLKSPAQIEKLIGGKKSVTKLAYVPEAGLTIAPSADKRAEVTRSAEDIFGDIE